MWYLSKKNIRQDSDKSKIKFGMYMSFKGEVEVRVGSVWLYERGVYYCGVQLRELGVLNGCRSIKVKLALQFRLCFVLFI